MTFLKAVKLNTYEKQSHLFNKYEILSNGIKIISWMIVLASGWKKNTLHHAVRKQSNGIIADAYKGVFLTKLNLQTR